MLKKKNDKNQPAKEGYDVFQEGKDNFPPPQLYYIERGNQDETHYYYFSSRFNRMVCRGK